MSVDVGDGGQVDRVFDETVREYGRLDVVVHAAGVDDPGRSSGSPKPCSPTGRPR
ncbi:SDR family oxidoreductase [Streptomyces mirabilis]|nr:SDR family oxidoreductase [Streptomyces mirabilis]